MPVVDSIKKGFSSIVDFFKSGSALSKIILAILFIIIVMVLVHTLISIYRSIYKFYYSRIWIPGDVNAICPKTSKHVSGEIIHRSQNELGGSEFTYAFWIFISDWTFKQGQWKHVLHKGNSNSWPNRAPGIWLHPTENTMRCYMNTYDSIAGNYIDIPNIPIKKWFHVTLSVNQLTMDLYINGNLRKSHKFTGLPKQNYGDIWIMNNRGFDGFLSRIVYYSYAIPYSEIEYLMDLGPGNLDCGKKLDMPPYLTPGWWTNPNN